jgi:hypothetical protein
VHVCANIIRRSYATAYVEGVIAKGLQPEQVPSHSAWLLLVPPSELFPMLDSTAAFLARQVALELEFLAEEMKTSANLIKTVYDLSWAAHRGKMRATLGGKFRAQLLADGQARAARGSAALASAICRPIAAFGRGLAKILANTAPVHPPPLGSMLAQPMISFESAPPALDDEPTHAVQPAWDASPSGSPQLPSWAGTPSRRLPQSPTKKRRLNVPVGWHPPRQWATAPRPGWTPAQAIEIVDMGQSMRRVALQERYGIDNHPKKARGAQLCACECLC